MRDTGCHIHFPDSNKVFLKFSHK